MYMDPWISQDSRRHLEMLPQQVSGPTNKLWLCHSQNGGQRCICVLRHMDSVAAARLGSCRLGSWWVIDVSSMAELQQLATLSPNALCYTTKSSKNELPWVKPGRAETSHGNTTYGLPYVSEVQLYK